MIRVFVGSTNPVKINAVKLAMDSLEIDVTGLKTPSNVDEQPRSDEETRKGAQNRAKAAWVQGKKAQPGATEVIGIGLEGGVMDHHNGDLWSTVWICLTDDGETLYESNGARFPIPAPFDELIRSGGEMGPVVAKITGVHNVKHKEGMIGVITDNFVQRTEVYAAIAKIAVGLWQGHEWQEKLQQ